jgi:Ni2+-binding GTPase involved in maturation of urease and hydrogenase
VTQARFILVGGFLGAGKTTALAQLARRYAERGLGVGLITNDQAADLVDTGNLRARGFSVEEVAGGCFCCRFDDLARAADRLRAADRPHILIGEPVGSCTDLVATVIHPMKKIYGDAYSVGAYSVLLDPARAEQMFLKAGFGGFSSNVAYIFRKQLEEADVILLNKIDTISETTASKILEAIDIELPGKQLLRVSASTGQGLDAWTALLDEPVSRARNIIDVDYDTYAAGEAELGWLNARLTVNALGPFSADDFVLDILSGIRLSLASARLEPAHLKVMFRDRDTLGASVANLIRSDDPGSRSRSMGRPSREGTLIVNARVHEGPSSLRARVETVLAQIADRYRLSLSPVKVRSFKPARPVPIHRYRSPAV